MANTHVSKAACLSGLLLATGCSVALGYPELTDEELACGDLGDDDGDGLIDCDDPDCDGQCPEDSERSCADRRDNDGDGRVDALDPTCWPHGPPTIHEERCSIVGGIDIDLSGTTFWDDALVRRFEPITGGAFELDVVLRVRELGAADPVFRLTLVEQRFERPLLEIDLWHFFATEGCLRVNVANSGFDPRLAEWESMSCGPIRMQVRMGAGESRAAVTVTDVESGRTFGQGTFDLPERTIGEPLQVRMQIQSSTEPRSVVTLDDGSRLSTEPVDLCGEASFSAPIDEAIVPRAAAAMPGDEGAFCVLAQVPGRPNLASLEFRSGTWTLLEPDTGLPGSVFGRLPGRADDMSFSLATTGDGRLEGFMFAPFRTAPLRALFVEEIQSTDCVRWQRFPVPEVLLPEQGTVSAYSYLPGVDRDRVSFVLARGDYEGREQLIVHEVLGREDGRLRLFGIPEVRAAVPTRELARNLPLGPAIPVGPHVVMLESLAIDRPPRAYMLQPWTDRATASLTPLSSEHALLIGAELAGGFDVDESPYAYARIPGGDTERWIYFIGPWSYGYLEFR